MTPIDVILYGTMPITCEEGIHRAEGMVPALAQSALRKERDAALDSGVGVLEVDLEGNLFQYWKDINTPDKFIKKLQPAYKIEIGTTRSRPKAELNNQRMKNVESNKLT